MIYKNNHDTLAIFFGIIEIARVYKGLKLIWSKVLDPDITNILSCYFNGYWIDEYPWTDDTPWKD